MNQKKAKALRKLAGITRANGNKHVRSRYEAIFRQVFTRAGRPYNAIQFVVAKAGVHIYRKTYLRLKREARAAGVA